jgi:hypothetical protein
VFWLDQLFLDVRQRVRCLLFRDRLRRELDQELQFHLEMRRNSFRLAMQPSELFWQRAISSEMLPS